MATTHALAGVLIGLAAAGLAGEPALAAPLALAGAVGGFAPDLDLLGRHRRDLHFPGYGSLAALAAVGVALAVPTVWTLALAVGLLAATLHAVSDAFGGGLDLRPWEARDDRGVYAHVAGRWLRARRWIRYDGAPEDCLLGIGLALPAFAALEGPGRWGVLALVAVSVAYTALRRRLVDDGEALVERAPEALVDAVPETLIEDLR